MSTVTPIRKPPRFSRRYRIWVRLHKHWGHKHPWRQAWHDALGPKRPMTADDWHHFAVFMYVVGACNGFVIGVVLTKWVL